MFELSLLPENVQAILEPHEAGQRLMPLAPRKPLKGKGLDLLRKTPASEFGDGEWGECIRSALFLYFSSLGESHEISQGISSATGSLLHGIMHRQEPDYSNAKYWFRKVGDHDVFPELREDALALETLDHDMSASIEARSQWDPLWFVDQCELGARQGGALAGSLMEIQRSEWQLVLQYCVDRAG